jgi:hypothetical protein
VSIGPPLESGHAHGKGHLEELEANNKIVNICTLGRGVLGTEREGTCLRTVFNGGLCW